MASFIENELTRISYEDVRSETVRFFKNYIKKDVIKKWFNIKMISKYPDKG